MTDKPAVSVILPTIRPQLVEACLQNLKGAHRDIPTEIVVVADFACPSHLNHSPWYVRNRNGVIDAINLGYQASQGEYVFLTNDETTMGEDCIAKLYDAAQKHQGHVLGPCHLPPYTFVYYDKPFIPFIFAHRAVIERCGGFLDPTYRAFYADPDFSLRAHQAGVPLTEIPEAEIHHHNTRRPDHEIAVSKWLEADRAEFRRRWDHLGPFRDC